MRSMMEDIINIILIVVVIGLCYWKISKIRKIHDSGDELLVNLFNYKYYGFFNYVILPAFLGLSLGFILSMFGPLISPVKDISSFLRSIFFASLFEEIFMRGLIFGSMILLISKYKKKLSKIINLLLITLSLITQAVIFTKFHYLINPIDIKAFPSLFLNGILYGLLYIRYDKSLLPSTIAHIFYNFLVFVYDILIF